MVKSKKLLRKIGLAELLLVDIMCVIVKEGKELHVNLRTTNLGHKKVFLCGRSRGAWKMVVFRRLSTAAQKRQSAHPRSKELSLTLSPSCSRLPT